VSILRNAQGQKRSRYGGVLISALAFMVVVSLLLAGIGTLTVSHYGRAHSESDYAAALSLAEAGINYEYRKISLNSANADQAGTSNPPGVSYNFGGGTFRVYCTNKDGTTPWTAPGLLYVIATGTFNGATRTIKVASKGFPPTGKFAIYTLNSISVWNGSAISIVGDVGSNGLLDFSGHPGISGSVYFNGPNAGWYGGVAPSGYNVVQDSKPIQWDTVDQKALKLFPPSLYPPGGLAYLATNNNNANAVPPIVGNSITASVTLKGPGNYYVTNINLTGNKKISLDNTNGPINLWIGPSGGTGTARFRGGTAAVSATTNPNNKCNIYVATKSGIDLAGNEEIDAAIYAYNIDANGASYGYVKNSGNPVINGQILANEADINGNLTVNYMPGYITPTSYGYYGYDNSWVEINGVY